MTLCEEIGQKKYSNSKKYKSAGGRRIAEFLTRKNIAFIYEKPLTVVNENQVRIFYPDYTLHDFGTIIEYFGINGNPDYIAGTNRKIDIYQKIGEFNRKFLMLFFLFNEIQAHVFEPDKRLLMRPKKKKGE